MAITFSEEQIRYARGRVHYFANEWFAEVPTKMHVSSRVFDESGAPAFTEEFRAYLDEGLRSKRHGYKARGPHDVGLPRRRVTDAFRTLRSKAPREYDAMNCLTVIDQVGWRVDPSDDRLALQFESSLRATAERFNLRAEQRGEPVRYTSNDVLLLVISAVDKLDRWAG